jgi:hypothetical protein
VKHRLLPSDRVDLSFIAATSLVSFAQLIGASVGVAIATSVFDNELGKFLKFYAPNAPLETVKNSVLSIYTLPANEIPGVVQAYVRALDYVYVSMKTGLSCWLVDSGIILDYCGWTRCRCLVLSSLDQECEYQRPWDGNWSVYFDHVATSHNSSQCTYLQLHIWPRFCAVLSTQYSVFSLVHY